MDADANGMFAVPRANEALLMCEFSGALRR